MAINNLGALYELGRGVPMDKFKAMQTFVRIADEGTLTRAAHGLGLSLPAVVRSLAA